MIVFHGIFKMYLLFISFLLLIALTDVKCEAKGKPNVIIETVDKKFFYFENDTVHDKTGIYVEADGKPKEPTDIPGEEGGKPKEPIEIQSNQTDSQQPIEESAAVEKQSNRADIRQFTEEVDEMGIQDCLNLKTVKKPEDWISLFKDPCSSLSGPTCDKTSIKHVAIVGAGMAGLTMAYLMKSVGHNVTLVEKSNRIGGRVDTVYKNGWYADVGAMRFKKKDEQPLTFATVEKFLGVSALGSFTNTHKGHACYYFVNDRIFLSKMIKSEDKKTLKSLYKIFGIRNSRQFYNCFRNQTNHVNGFNAKTMYKNPSKILNQIVSKQTDIEFMKQCMSRLSLRKHIENEIKNKCHIDSHQLRSLLTYFEIMDLLRAFYPLSTLKFIEFFPFNEDIQLIRRKSDYTDTKLPFYETKFYEIVNGSSRLPNAIIKYIKENFDKDFQVVFNKSVKNIYNKSDGVKLTFEDGSSIVSDYIFMTPTAGVVSLLNFSPPLPENKKLAIADIHYASTLKIFLNFDFPFWQYPGNGKVKKSIPYNSSGDKGGTYITDLPVRHGYYPSHPYHGTSILASYVWEDDAERLMALSDEELVNLALDNLEILHGDDVRKHFKGGKENYEVKKWGNDESTHGGFVWNYPGQIPDLHFLLKDSIYEGKVQFGGEYTQTEGLGWIQSAIESALYSADQIFGKEDGKSKESRKIN